MENESLSKNDLVWVIVRLLGLFLAVGGVWTLYDIFTQLIVIHKLNGRYAAESLWMPGVRCVIQIAIGIYLLRRGRLVRDLLMFSGLRIGIPESHGGRGAPPRNVIDPVTTLTLEETEEFKKWLELQPFQLNDSLEDQIARFRDFQREGK